MSAWIRRFRQNQEPELPDEDDIVEVEEPDDPSSEVVYIEAARHYIDKQIGAYDVLDTKAGQYFSTGSFAFPVTFTLINLAPDRVEVPSQAVWSLWGAFGAYAFLIIFVALAGRHKTTAYGAYPEEVKELSLTELPGIGLQRWVADTYTRSSHINRGTLARKGLWVGWANVAMWAEGLCLALAALLTLWLGL